MTIHAFGNDVEEVQRKLSEILPLVDAGAERVSQLHETLRSEFAGYQSSYETWSCRSVKSRKTRQNSVVRSPVSKPKWNRVLESLSAASMRWASNPTAACNILRVRARGSSPMLKA